MFQMQNAKSWMNDYTNVSSWNNIQKSKNQCGKSLNNY